MSIDATQLGPDIILQIFQFLDLEDALSLSATCLSLRSVIIPEIFSVVNWPRKGRSVEFYPRSLWQWIRTVAFLSFPSSLPQHEAALQVLNYVLPCLPNLRKFLYVPPMKPTEEFACTLAHCLIPPCRLESLTINTAFMFCDFSSMPDFSGLQEVVILAPESFTMKTAPEAKQERILNFVAALLSSSCETLENVKLPGEFLPVSDFTVSEDDQFPQLKTLILTGFPPLNIDSEPTAVLHLLQRMPLLTRLSVQCKLRIAGAKLQPFALLPSDVRPAPGTVHVFPPLLESLELRNPALDDRVFKRLPPRLRDLVLDWTPDGENVTSSPVRLAYHHPDTLTRLFKAMLRQDGAREGMERVVIKMGWQATPQMINALCQLFPNLVYLEIQGIRYFKNTECADDQMDTFIEAFWSLTRLRTLLVALELKEDEFTDNSVRQIGSVRQSAWRWAHALSEELPTLRTLALEVRPHTVRHVGPRIVSGKPHWIGFRIDERSRAMEGFSNGVGEEEEWMLAKDFRGVTRRLKVSAWNDFSLPPFYTP